MGSEWELDEGVKSIESAWRREHTARVNLEKMLEQTEAENAKLWEQGARLFDKTLELSTDNAKLRELVQAMWDMHVRSKKKPTAYGWVAIQEQAEELGIELVWS